MGTYMRNWGYLIQPNGTKAKIIFPYELITQFEIDHLGSKARPEIFSRCKSNLDDTDIVIALLDGSQVDDGTSWEISFYLYALLFVIFDIETVFLYPWAISFRRLGVMGFGEMILFIAILLVGLGYAWKKEALKWD